FFCIILHICFNAAFGVCALLYRDEKERRPFFETLLLGILLGWLLESFLIAILLYIKIPFAPACGFSIFLIAVFILATIVFKRKEIRFTFPRLGSLRWYEWILTVSLTEKFYFILWQLTSVKIWADDALTHWAGRGRCLYGGINWSLDPRSPVFLGHTSGAKNYPIATPIWRAVTAVFNGGWNDVIARSDSLLFFILVLWAVWTIVYRFSKERYLAAGATFIVLALPFHIWHGVAGYNDIGLEAMLLGALVCYFRGAWFLAGIFIAGCGWMKNEGWVIYIPAFLFGLSVHWKTLWSSGNPTAKKMILKQFAWFAAGTLIIIGPRFLFNHFYRQDLRFYAAPSRLFFHPIAVKSFFNAVVTGPTHSIFWILIPLMLGICFPYLRKDLTGKFLITFFAAVVLETLSAYFFTQNLNIETSVHRNMLQIYGLSAVVLAYGCWLGTQKHPLKR
ncbi:MAG: hypothetical protein L7F78_06830, partial [Syntrophales bacterium LBB04]|nr:hypothetical protein [Syntrophales bacterium LBB04]